MKKAAILLLSLLITTGAYAQKTPVKKARSATISAAQKPPLSEKERFEAASALETAGERVPALLAFITDFPESEYRAEAMELVASSRALMAEEKLISGDGPGAYALYKLIVEEAPTPYSKELFSETISRIPVNLFRHGRRSEALEAAALIETAAADNAQYLLDLATFHMSIENGDAAIRLAEKAVALDPNSARAYQTVGMAYRLNFRLEESAAAYSKALEIEPSSALARRNLAEMKRALGKPDEAVSLYREILATDEANVPAQTGLILSLFNAGKRTEAEAEMSRALAANPNNIILLAGAAYWYAANGEGSRAVELAQAAVSNEPRYIWSHIALARGQIARKNPLEAERVLINAQQYGNFPTLSYELANVRLAAGFYRESAEELRKAFTLREGKVQTRLGGRITAEDSSFTGLLAAERRASIFEPSSADDAETAAQLKALLELDEKVESAADEAAAARAADDFTAGSDKMKLHRQLYAATRLLEKRIALDKVVELTTSALGGSEGSLDVAAPNAAVMASELYESRKIAFTKGEVVLVPDVPRPTLSAIVRGRIEELAGTALFYQNNAPAAVIRLKRAVSVLPVNSAWWRSGMWRLGSALEAAGSDKEALDAYIKSYRADRPDPLRYIALEAVYRRVHGSTEGLDTQIGVNPASATAAEATRPAPVQAVEAAAAATPEHAAAPVPQPAPVRIPKGVPVAETPAAVLAEKQKVIAETAPPVEMPAPVETKPAEALPEATVEETAEAKTAPAAEKAAEAAAPAVETEAPKTEPETPQTVNEVPAVQAAPVPEASPAPAGEEFPTESKIEPAAEPLPVEYKTETAPEAEAKTETAEPTTVIKPVEPASEPVKEVLPERAPEPKAAVPEPERSAPTAAPEIEKEPEPNVTKEDDDRPSGSTPLRERTSAAPPGTEGRTRRDIFERPRKAPELVITDGLAKPTPKPAPARERRTTPPDKTGSLFEPVIIRIPRSEQSTPAEDSSAKQSKPCSITVSQDSISLINGGGRIGLIVGLSDEEGDVNLVTARSSSPDDVDVTLESEIAGVSGRAFYLIRSVSRNVGMYNVVFEAPCGRKEVVVRVR